MAKKKQKSFWHFVKLGLNHLSVLFYKAILGLLYGIKIASLWTYKKLKSLYQQRQETAEEQKIIKKRKSIEKERNIAEPQYEQFKVLRKLKGDFNKFEKYLLSSTSTIGIILGARGTGKSAISMKLLENFAAKTNKKIFAMGFKEETLPTWITVIKDINQIENHSVLLVDESGIAFSSRNSMSDANKLLSEILLIARHKDLSVLFISQNSSNIDINAIRQTDYLLLKPSSLLQHDFERRKIRDIYKNVDLHFKQLKDDKGLTYIYSEKFRGFTSNNLPTFWSTKVSKGFSNFKK